MKQPHGGQASQSSPIRKSGKVPLFETKQAMQALRSSGHTFESAIGEVIDNAQEAEANRIHILLEATDPNKPDQLDRVVVIDDGKGMSKEILPMAIGLGATTRFNSRSGIGRFGVGATLGGISQARRLDYFSREKGGQTHHTYLDIDELDPDENKVIEPFAQEFPAELGDLLPKHGTVVIWTKIDANIDTSMMAKARKYKTLPLKEIIDEVTFYVARTYRIFLEAGLEITVNGTKIIPWDPLFLMDHEKYPDHKKSECFVDREIIFETNEGVKSPVQIRVALLDEMFRLERFKGAEDKNQLIRQRKVHRNEGISILRNNREIFFGIIQGFMTQGTLAIDRFIGIEIAFNAELDEYFAVKHVKKGAEPIERLRNQIKKELQQPVMMLRDRIQETFRKTQQKETVKHGAHHEAEEAAAEYEKASPKGEGAAKTKEEVAETIEKVASLVVESGAAGTRTKEDIKRRISERPFSIENASWPGREFINIEHLGASKAVITLNNRHLFYTEVYEPIMRAAGYIDRQEGEELTKLSQEDVVRIKNALDLLIVAYAKAEGMDESCKDCHERLRGQWGTHMYGMIKKLGKKDENS